MKSETQTLEGAGRSGNETKTVSAAEALGVTVLGPRSVWMSLREWIDALVIAFIAAMFIRTFVVELFKIPSGSMTPTLLGDFVAEGVAADEAGNQDKYLLVKDRNTRDIFQVFRIQDAERFIYEGRKAFYQLTSSQQQLAQKNGLTLEEHRIFVNKFAYWFKQPDRGDIVVFRVPFESEVKQFFIDGHPFQKPEYVRAQPIYVKRCVGLPEERVQIPPDGQIIINGEPVLEPTIFSQVKYSTNPRNFDVTVPPNEYFMFGDNTDNSLDSRSWGGVPGDNLRGKAFFRYWPWGKMSFLK